MTPPTNPPHESLVYPVYYFSRPYVKCYLYFASNSTLGLEFACAWRDAHPEQRNGSYLDVARPLRAGEKANSYRKWDITWEYGSWCAVSDNYDASWEGEEDGWVDNGERCFGSDLVELIEEIDNYEAEHGERFPVGVESLSNWEAAGRGVR